jgi:hypothetical protein
MSSKHPRTARRVISIGFLLFAGCPGLSQDAPEDWSTLPAFGVVLPQSEATKLFVSCDGQRTFADSVWIPDDSTITRLERRVSERIRAMAPETAAPLRQYSRQYVGFFRSDTALILINGVHQHYLQAAVDHARTVDGTHESPVDQVSDWFRLNAVRVCDGGRAFFRAEYNAAADTIMWFVFNARV